MKKKISEITAGFKNLLSSVEYVEEIAAERREICNVCPYKLVTNCKLCSCGLAAKQRSVLSECPADKWPVFTFEKLIEDSQKIVEVKETGQEYLDLVNDVLIYNADIQGSDSFDKLPPELEKWCNLYAMLEWIGVNPGAYKLAFPKLTVSWLATQFGYNMTLIIKHGKKWLEHKRKREQSQRQ